MKQMNNNFPKEGEIWMAYIPETRMATEHSYVGYHPYLIVSNNKFNMYSGMVDAIPFTTKRWNSNSPVHVKYASGEIDGMDKDCTLVCEGRTAVDQTNLKFKVGQFSDKDWNKAAIGMALQTPRILKAFEQGIQHTQLYQSLCS